MKTGQNVMYSAEYFDHLAACNNEIEVLAALMRLAGLDISEQLLNTLSGPNGFDLRAVLARNFSILERENALGERGAKFLKFLHVIILQYQRAKLAQRDLISDIHTLHQYLKLRMGPLTDEVVIALLLDSSNHLICETIIATGTSNRVNILPRQILKNAIEKSASAIIIVHNHPGGSPQPSNDDIRITKELINIFRPLDITFHDHIIICRDNAISLRERGYICIDHSVTKLGFQRRGSN